MSDDGHVDRLARQVAQRIGEQGLNRRDRMRLEVLRMMVDGTEPSNRTRIGMQARTLIAVEVAEDLMSLDTGVAARCLEDIGEVRLDYGDAPGSLARFRERVAEARHQTEAMLYGPHGMSGSPEG